MCHKCSIGSIGSTMKLNKSMGSIPLDAETIAAFTIGAAASSAVNGFLTPFTQDKDGNALPSEELAKNGKIVALAKTILGFGAAYKMKQKALKAGGVGFGLIGAVELFNLFLPENFDNPFIAGIEMDYGHENIDHSGEAVGRAGTMYADAVGDTL